MGQISKNPSKHALYMREWKKRNPQFREYQKQWDAERTSTEEGKTSNRTRANNWAASNRDRSRSKAKQWRACNRERSRTHARRSQSKRRALLKGAQVLPIDYEAIHRKARGMCGICKEELKGAFHYDHIIPISRGGAHSTDNIQLAHPLCNQIKFNRVMP